MRARVPLAHRLSDEDHLRNVGRHAGFRQRQPGGRYPCHRRKPHRWPSGLRKQDEKASARGREADRHRSATHRPGKSPHVGAEHHLPLRPGTNVAVLTAMAHVIVTERLYDEAFIRERWDWDEFQDWA